jgi:hypothetical protein
MPESHTSTDLGEAGLRAVTGDSGHFATPIFFFGATMPGFFPSNTGEDVCAHSIDELSSITQWFWKGSHHEEDCWSSLCRGHVGFVFNA